MGTGAFNLDQRLCAMRPPAFVHGGVEYVGRLASWEQATRWGAAVAALGASLDPTDPAVVPRLAALLQEVTAALFPAPPPPPWWRRWSRVPSAAEVVAGLHPTLQYELLLSFCGALATMMPQAPGPMTGAATMDSTTTTPAPAGSPGSS